MLLYNSNHTVYTIIYYNVSAQCILLYNLYCVSLQFVDILKYIARYFLRLYYVTWRDVNIFFYQIDTPKTWLLSTSLFIFQTTMMTSSQCRSTLYLFDYETKSLNVFTQTFLSTYNKVKVSHSLQNILFYFCLKLKLLNYV